MSNNIPYMDKHPELKLRPVSEFPDFHKLPFRYDYVQNLNLNGENAIQGYFYLTVIMTPENDARFGVFMYNPGLFFRTTSIALKPKYEEISIYYYKGRHFRAIIKEKGKYGIILWTYSHLFNQVTKIKPVYDSIVRIDQTRFKAVKENQTIYLDAVGNILR